MNCTYPLNVINLTTEYNSYHTYTCSTIINTILTLTVSDSNTSVAITSIAIQYPLELQATI